MSRRIAKKIHSFFTQPLFGTKVFPKNISVNPDEFPEDEYPVYCESCGYELRGLPNSICPECGSLFNRGHLLSQQYVYNPKGGQWKHTTAGRWCLRFYKVGGALFVLNIVFLMMWLYLGPDSGTVSMPVSVAHSETGMIIYAVIKVFAFLIVFVAVLINLATFRRAEKKRRKAVRSAILQTAEQQPLETKEI